MWDNFFTEIFELNIKYYVVLLKGLGMTLLIALSAFVFGIIIGTIVAIIKTVPKNTNSSPVTGWILKILDWLCSAYVAIIRGTPIVVQLLLMFFAILAPLHIEAVIIAIIVFSINSGAYVSEIMRGGLLSIDKGQMEAGRSLGLPYITTMLKVIVPQAIKNIIPTLGNELIALLKETSVAGYITVIDVTMTTQRIIASEYTALVPYMNLAFIYLILVGILTFGLKKIERRLRSSDKRN